MTLKLIDGGKTSAAAANGGTGGEKFKWHPLAEALYIALTKNAKDAKNVGQIAAEMSRLLRKKISRGQVYDVIRHVRDHISEYEWMVTFVQKGNGKRRMYWVQDGTEAISAKHKDAFEAATISFWRDVATRISHYDTQAAVVADSEDLSRSERRKYNKLAGDTAAVKTLVDNVLASVSA